MEAIMQYPKLRYGLEAVPAMHQNQEVILLRDRLGYCESSLLISPALLGLLTLMDGRNSVRDLQAHYFRSTGEMLFTETLEDVLSKLDEHLFLENDRFIGHVARIAASFRDDPIRHMALAGRSYPDSPAELRRRLDGFFSTENGGPGPPRPGACDKPLAALVAPHIDLDAGGATFAHAYKALGEAPALHTWVVLGTGHEPADNLFALTEKDFETPLGLVKCDRAFCRELVERSSRDIKASEYNHRQEHTIEFQAVFLAHLQPEALIVPLLCSFSHREWESDGGYIDEIATLLGRIADESPYPVGFLASVDLAHVGPRYGDSFQPHNGVVREHLEADRVLMECLERCDPADFMRLISREDNRRNVCGVAPLYVLARVLEGRARGRLLHHGFATVDGRNSFVTFAGMAFERV